MIDRKIRKQTALNESGKSIKCIGLDSIPLNSNIVINTAVADISEIRKNYSLLPEDFKIISVFDIIDKMKKNEMRE